MKPIRIVLISTLLVASAIAAIAAPGPPSKSVFSASARRTDDDFKSLKAGDKIALVCKECESVTVQTVESPEAAMKLCKEGETVVCGSCNKVAKIVRRGPRSKNSTSTATEVRYVNDKGEDCMFIVKLES
jgi:hypothetical protein